MMYSPINRRQFLMLSGLSLSGLALAPFPNPDPPDHPADSPLSVMVGRVTRNAISIYQEPDLASPRLGKLARDEILNLHEIIYAQNGPAHNPRWYKLDSGYVHSAYIQRMENIHLNSPLVAIPARGILGQITVPFTQSFFLNRQGFWVKLYRLYYGSVHWIKAIVENQDGEVCYLLKDELLKVEFSVLANHVEPLDPGVFAPVSTNIPDAEKRIEVSLSSQDLWAYEGDRPVYHCSVSTGKKYMETPTGTFQVDRKFPSKHMGNGGLTSDPRAYELVGVPWTTFFHEAGIAFHGTFWHDNFGTPMSRGCVNLRNEDALWLFRWTLPDYQFTEDDKPTWKVSSRQGTTVIVT